MAERDRGEVRPAPELSLVFADRDGNPVVFGIPEGTTTVGRAADNDLVLSDPSVGAHQVVLMRQGSRVELRDLFAGETRVNDQPRRNGTIGPGDVLSLGAVRMRVMKVAPSATTQSLRRSGSTRRLATGRTRRAKLHQDGGSSGEAPPLAPTEALRSTQATRRPAAPDGGDADARLARERDARRARALARARQLADEVMSQDDFEVILERLALGFLDVFSADRAVTLLFEEDGRNPLLVVERRRDGTNEGAGVAQEIIDRCLQVRSVIRIAGGAEGLGGLAAPLVTQGRALGLLYFERNTFQGLALAADDVHIMALLTNLSALVIAPLV